MLGVLDLAHAIYPSFVWGRHHQFIAQHLEKLGRGELLRLALSEPPQTGKSTLASVFLAWHVLNFPSKNIVLASYSAALAEAHSERAMRAVETHGWLTGVKLGHRQAKSHWTTSKGGQCVAASLLGGITGRPADLILIDDYCKNDEEANSFGIREKILREFTATCETRLSPTGKILILATRWHPGDLIGAVLDLAAKGGQQWHYVRLPALCDSEDDPLGREIGESIWPERYPAEFYQQRQKQYELLGQSWQWESLYQQNPISGAGHLEWSPAYFQNIFFDDNTKPPAELVMRVQSCDPSLGRADKPGDYQAHCMLDLLKDGTILVDCWMQKQTVETLVDFLISLWQQYQPKACGIETGLGQQLYGPMIIQKAKYLSPMPIPLYGFINSNNKVVRIRQGLSPLLAQRRLKFRRSMGCQLLVNQLREFPTGKFDDGPDSLELGIQLINRLLTGDKKHKELTYIT